MSDISADMTMAIDVQEQLARIRRMQVESDKFMAEQRKLISEADKLNRDRYLSVWIVLSATIGSIAGAVAATVAVLRATGTLH